MSFKEKGGQKDRHGTWSTNFSRLQLGSPSPLKCQHFASTCWSKYQASYFVWEMLWEVFQIENAHMAIIGLSWRTPRMEINLSTSRSIWWWDADVFSIETCPYICLSRRKFKSGLVCCCENFSGEAASHWAADEVLWHTYAWITPWCRCSGSYEGRLWHRYMFSGKLQVGKTLVDMRCGVGYRMRLSGKPNQKPIIHAPPNFTRTLAYLYFTWYLTLEILVSKSCLNGAQFWGHKQPHTPYSNADHRILIRPKLMEL